MKKEEAQILLVSEKIESLGYSIGDSNGEGWSKCTAEEIEACFELSRIGKSYYPSHIKALHSLVNQLEVCSYHDEEDEKEMKRVRSRINYFMESRGIDPI